MSAMTATDARRTLPELLDRVSRGERVSITRHGRVVAVLVSPDVLAQRPAAIKHAEQLAERLQTARTSPLPEPSIDSARADELVAAIEADRTGR